MRRPKHGLANGLHVGEVNKSVSERPLCIIDSAYIYLHSCNIRVASTVCSFKDTQSFLIKDQALLISCLVPKDIT